MFPDIPFAAVIHANPYPWYATLVKERPLYFDAALRLWIATSAEAVTAVLTRDRCRVRPVREPVPPALLGSSAGDLFSQLVRMTDGDRHDSLKRAVSSALALVDCDLVADQSRRWARVLLRQRAVELLLNVEFALPVHVMGSVLGIPDALLLDTVLWMRDFVRCIAPGSSPDQIERGKLAAERLSDMLQTVLTDAPETGLLAALRHELPDETPAVVANAIGFLFQVHDATAGLIGNTVHALAAHPELDLRHEDMHEVVLEVLRYDSPVQNTRRFVAEDGVIAGEMMRAGDTILVVLAAANRDPASNPNPERFDIHRPNRRVFTFGAGVHACPGDHFATTIAVAAVEQLLCDGRIPGQLTAPVTYHPSTNGRIPVLETLLEHSNAEGRLTKG